MKLDDLRHHFRIPPKTRALRDEDYVVCPAGFGIITNISLGQDSVTVQLRMEPGERSQREWRGSPMDCLEVVTEVCEACGGIPAFIRFGESPCSGCGNIGRIAIANKFSQTSTK